MSDPSLFEKFATQLKGTLHDLADNMEDPGRTARQLVRDIDQAVGLAEEQLVQVRAQLNVLESKRDTEQREADRYAGYAQKAVTKGDDSMAREALTEKAKHAKLLAGYEAQIADFKPNMDNLEAEIQKLRDKKDSMENETNMLEARAATAQATNKAATIIGGIGAQASSAKRFDALGDRVSKMEAEARARAQMASTRNGDSMKDRFAALDSVASSVDDELAALKANSAKK